MPNGDLPPGYSLRPVTPSGDSSTGLPSGYSIRKLPVTEPDELMPRLEGAPGALAGWAKEHPVQAALTGAAVGAGPLVGLAGLEGLSAVAARTAVQGAIGAGAGYLSGEGTGTGLKAGLESGAMGEAVPAVLGPVGRRISGVQTFEQTGKQVMRESEADAAQLKALENELGVSRKQAQSQASPTLQTAPTPPPQGPFLYHGLNQSETVIPESAQTLKARLESIRQQGLTAGSFSPRPTSISPDVPNLAVSVADLPPRTARNAADAAQRPGLPPTDEYAPDYQGGPISPHKIHLSDPQGNITGALITNETLPGASETVQGLNAIRAARTSARHAIGAKFDPIYGPVDDLRVYSDDLGKIGQTAREQHGWLYERQPQLSRETQKILQGFSQYEGTANAVKAGSNIGGQGLSNEQIAQINSMGLPRPSPTIGQLRGQFRQLIEQANSPGISDMERRALRETAQPIRETLDNVIDDSQKPLLQKVKDEYSRISRIVPFKYVQQVGNAKTLPDLGKLAFNAPPTTSMVLSRMGEPEKRLMREAWAAHVLSSAKSPTEVQSILAKNADTVKALYPDSDFGRIQTWRDMIVKQRQFAKGPNGLPSQRAFEQQLEANFKKYGLTPEAEQAGFQALANSGAFKNGMPHGMARYLLVTGPIMGAMGWGPYHHVPELAIPAVAYGAGIAGWRALANNPEMLNLYRNVITSGWTKNGADAFARLFIAGVNDAYRNGGMPEKQLTEPMKDMSEGTDALNEFRAEQLAPTPSASDRAKKVSSELDKGKRPEVHRDLNRGRLSSDEVGKMLQFASSKDASQLIAGLPLSEVMDSAEQASPEEKEMLLPLIKQRLMKELPQQKNQTLVANLSKRFMKLQQMVPQQQEAQA